MGPEQKEDVGSWFDRRLLKGKSPYDLIAKQLIADQIKVWDQFDKIKQKLPKRMRFCRERGRLVSADE